MGFCLGYWRFRSVSLLCFCFCCCCFRYFWRGRQNARERKKCFLISERMNSSSLSWASYCSSAWGIWSNGEVSVVGFAEVFVKFWVFQPNRETDNNALTSSYFPCDFIMWAFLYMEHFLKSLKFCLINWVENFQIIYEYYTIQLIYYCNQTNK